jgi:hypothetical protein
MKLLYLVTGIIIIIIIIKWFRMVDGGYSLHRPEFNPWLRHVIFMTDGVVLSSFLFDFLSVSLC